jgi:hypothetical protein
MGGSSKKQKDINQEISTKVADVQLINQTVTGDAYESEDEENINRNDKREQITVTEHAYKPESIEAIKIQIKENSHNKEIRKELIKEFVRIKKEFNSTYKPVFVNGLELNSDAPPVLKDGRMLIPVRAVTNALGAKVEWDAATRTATIIKTVTDSATGTEKEIIIKIQLDSNIVLVDGEEVKIDVPAELSNERTYVPIRFIAETFKQKVEWDEETGTVIIEDEVGVEATPTPTPTPAPVVAPTPTPVPAQ